MLFPSANNVFMSGLLAASLVAAHGKIAVAVGDAGGNGTALGIQGGIIPGAGPNSATEPDTTVFQGKEAHSCGETTGKGANKIQSGTLKAMALSGSTLPQVTMNGSLSGTLHIVTSDGAGPYKALLDMTGSGNFAHAVHMEVVTQVPGNNGNIHKSKKRWVRLLQRTGIMARATNINEDFPFKFAMPEGATCTGTVAGQKNVCMVKIVNPSNAGPFGGCVPVQMLAAATSNNCASGAVTAREFHA